MKYSKERVKELCKHIATGLNITDSCILTGITTETYYQWVRNKPDVSDAVKKAEMKNKQRALILIQQHGTKNWLANAWYLERKYQEEFALKTKIEHSGELNFTMSRFLEVVYDHKNGNGSAAQETERVPEKLRR